tara:strand:+ start:2494 stop:3540 length:1047 start_codon:yes stop_codon:yes gene_type:complete
MPTNTNPSKDINPINLDKLLEAHVKHELNHFKDSNFQKLVNSELTHLLESTSKTSLNHWVSAQTIKDVIKDHVVENSIPGSIADIAGKMSDSIFNSDFHKKTKLKNIISRQQFEEFIDKAIELKEQRNNGLDKLIDLPIYTDLISGILFQAITHYIYDNNLFSKKIPGMSSLLKAGKILMDKTAPKLGSGIEDSVRSYISDSLELIITESKAFLANSVTDEQLKDSAISLWENIENKSLADFQKGMNSLDLSEFIALGYNFWLTFRKSTYFKSCYETTVDAFFSEYGGSTIEELMEEFQITREKITTESARFAPLLIKGLKKSGYLEAAIRRHLEGFYSSKTAQNCFS